MLRQWVGGNNTNQAKLQGIQPNNNISNPAAVSGQLMMSGNSMLVQGIMTWEAPAMQTTSGWEPSTTPPSGGVWNAMRELQQDDTSLGEGWVTSNQVNTPINNTYNPSTTRMIVTTMWPPWWWWDVVVLRGNQEEWEGWVCHDEKKLPG